MKHVCITGSDGRCTRCRRRIQRGMVLIAMAVVSIMPCMARVPSVGADAAWMKHPKQAKIRPIAKTRKQPRVRKFR